MSLLGNKFQRTDRDSKEQLIRELVALVNEVDKRLTDIEARLTALETP